MIFITVSTGHFDPLIEKCNQLRDNYEFVGQIGCGKVVPDFTYFRTGEPEEIEDHMARAELVITHAGTGMLSSLYRLKKPSVVIPKQIRYGETNDGQVELAKKWEELGMTILCMDINDLPSAIEKCRQAQLTFRNFPSLGEHIRGLLEISQPEVTSIAS